MGILDLVGLFVAYGLVLSVFTYLVYTQVMKYKKMRDAGTLRGLEKAWAYVVLLVGLIADTKLNVVYATCLFVDPPRELLLTGRLKRYMWSEPSGSYRETVAAWICSRLDKHDEGHCY